MSVNSPNQPHRNRRCSEQRRKEVVDEVERRNGIERRVRRVLYGLIAAAMIVIFVLVAAWIVRQPSTYSSAEAPEVSTRIDAPAGISPEEPYFPLGADESAGKPIVDVYLDFMCPFCRWFPQINNDDIKRLVKRDEIVLRIHTTTMLDKMSTTGDYSTRAANAAACVYDSDPEQFLDFERRLFQHQPKEGSRGLTDGQLEEHASKAGVSSKVGKCIADRKYEQWLHGTIQTDALDRISGTPTIFIDGKVWDDKGELWTKPGKFRSAVLSTKR